MRIFTVFLCIKSDLRSLPQFIPAGPTYLFYTLLSVNLRHGTFKYDNNIFTLGGNQKIVKGTKLCRCWQEAESESSQDLPTSDETPTTREYK